MNIDQFHKNKLSVFKLFYFAFIYCSLILMSVKLLANDSVYCPQNFGYIKTGMSQADVVRACGQPISKKQSREPLSQKVSVRQLIYNSQGTPSAFYGVWNVPTGVNTGALLEVDIINDKVSSIRLNGSNTLASTICDGNITVGSPASSVTSACGDAPIVNETFIYQPVASDEYPEIWIYKLGDYQTPTTLTFLKGKLQSIQ